MRIRPATCAVFVAMVALAGACGGGGGKSATTTSSAPADESTTSTQPSTTSTTIDPALRELLLVAADLPGFKETEPAPTGSTSGSTSTSSSAPSTTSGSSAGSSSTSTPGGAGASEDDLLQRCEDDAPELKDSPDAPEIEGATFARGEDDAVEVSSSVTAADEKDAIVVMDAILAGKLTKCLEESVRAGAAAEGGAGVDLTIKTTVTKATVAGADQTALLSSAMTITASGVKVNFRFDLVFLRRAGAVVTVSYAGPTNLATVAERQRIIGVVSKKLQASSLPGGSSGSSTTSKSSTSVAGGGTSTSRRSSTTTRGSTSSSRSSSTTSTTR